MRILLVIVAIVIIAGSIFADYKWRQWMARHQRDRDR